MSIRTTVTLDDDVLHRVRQESQVNLLDVHAYEPNSPHQTVAARLV